MKILVLGDCHGRKHRIHFKDFDAIIMPGDVCSDKEIGPLYKGFFEYLKNNPMISFNDYLRSKGITKKDEEAMEKRSLKEGRKIMEYLNSFGKPVFFVPGNWDQSYGKTRIKDMDKSGYNYLKIFLDWFSSDRTNPKLIKGLKNVKDCQYKSHKFEGVNFVGYGLSSAPENLMNKKRKKKFSKNEKIKLRRAYERLINKLKKAHDKRNKKKPTIFISHNMPYGTKLDVIKNKKSVSYNKHTGSNVAREFCLKEKPLLCIGGHLHEHFGKVKLGKTTVINGGFGRDANVLIDISEKGKIKSIKFYKGYKKK